jgi:hypothetical protein
MNCRRPVRLHKHHVAGHLGQMRPMQVSYLLANDTLDVVLHLMLEKKRRIVNEVTDGKIHALYDVLVYLLQKG